MTQDLTSQKDIFSISDVEIGDEFRYISDIPDHSFEFSIIGMKNDKLNIIIHKDKPDVSLFSINIKELEKCIKIN